MMYGMGGIPDFRRPQAGMGGSSIPGLGSLLGQPNNPGGPTAAHGGGLTGLNQDGSMDVLGSLQAHGNFGTRFGQNAGTGPFGY